MKQKFKRLLSAILSIVLVIGGLQVSGWTSKATTASAASLLNENYIYLDPTGMTKGNPDWTSASTLYMWVENWSGFNASNGTTTINGKTLFYWDATNWDNMDKNFALLFENGWTNNVNTQHYYRTEVIGILQDAKGKVFKWGGGSTKITSSEGNTLEEYILIDDTDTYADSDPDPTPGGTTRTIYFDTTAYAGGGWGDAYIYMFNNDTGVTYGPVQMNKESTGVFSYTVDTTTYPSVVFKPNASNWSGKTPDQTIPADKDKFTCTKFGSVTSGIWGSYEESEEGAFPSNVTGKATFFDLYTDHEITGNNYSNIYTGNEARSLTSILRAFDLGVNGTIDQYWRNNTTNGVTQNNTTVYPLYFNVFDPLYKVWIKNTIPTAAQKWWASSDNVRYDGNDEKKAYENYANWFAGRLLNFSWWVNRSLDTKKADNSIDANQKGAVVQGLVDDELDTDGNITTGGVVLPQFNPEFYTNYKYEGKPVGTQYQTVDFPFAVRKIDGVNYYQFDSGVNNGTYKDVVRFNADKSALLYYDGTQDQGRQIVYGITAEGNKSPGFFPFNEPGDSSEADSYDSVNNRLNYGFGMKLEIQFTMDKDGKVSKADNKNDRVPATFEFSGDDDVWIYVDGNLALDLGGDHSVATGKIDFSSLANSDDATWGDITSTVSYVKAQKDDTDIYNTDLDTIYNIESGYNDPGYINQLGNNGVESNTNVGKTIAFDKTKEIHTLTIFYEERGMFESNFKATFNLEQPTKLKVTNEVNVDNINPALQAATSLVAANDTFGYTLADHTGNGGTNKTYTYTNRAGESVEVRDGKLTINDNQSATFVKQFDRKAKLSLVQAEYPKYTTSWAFSEMNEKEESGEIISASYVEGKDLYAVSDSRTGDPAHADDRFLLENKNIDEESVPARVIAEYIQNPKTGNISIKKELANGFTSDEFFTFEVTFTKVFGSTDENVLAKVNGTALTYNVYENDTLVAKRVATDSIIKIKAGQRAEITDIPVDSTYRITEDKGVNYSLRNIASDTKNNDESVGISLSSSTVTGTVAGDAVDQYDLFTFTNGEVTKSDEFLVEVDKTNTIEVVPDASVDGTLSGDLNDIATAYNNATTGDNPKRVTIVFVNEDGALETEDIGAGKKPKTSYTTDGVTYTVGTDENGKPIITFTPTSDTTTTKGKNTVTVKYQLVEVDENGIIKTTTTTVTDENGKSTTETTNNIITPVITATNYLYKANDDIYVLDYGLDVNLADTATNDGLFQNDTLANPSLTGTISTYWNTGKDNSTAAATASTTMKQNTDPASGEYGTITPAADASTGFAISNQSSTTEAVNPTVTYSLNKFLTNRDYFHYNVLVKKGDETGATQTSNRYRVNLTSNVTIMPASVVYYEDNFNATEQTTDGTKKIIYTQNSPTSAPDQKQSNDQSEQYGHDNAYANGVTFSAGSATELANGNKAFFEFTGTGFEIISRSNRNTGNITVYVYDAEKSSLNTINGVTYVKDAAEGIKSIMIVKTYYENGDLYQVPIIHKDGLKHGNYIVEIVSTSQTNESATVFIDGIRIYNPLEEPDTAYIDNEENAKTLNIKEALFGKGYEFNYDNPVNSVVPKPIYNQEGEITNQDELPVVSLYKYEDGIYLSGKTVVEAYKPGKDDSNIDQADVTNDMMTYAVQGPNNELYLDNSGYAIGFMVEKVDPEKDATVQIGLKVVNGNSLVIERLVDDEWEEWKTISTATENYYVLDDNGSDEFGIRVKSDTPGIVSVTNLKINNYKLQPIEIEEVDYSEEVKPELNPSNFVYKSGCSYASGFNKNQNATFTCRTPVSVEDVKIFSVNNGNTEVEITSKSSKVVEDSYRLWTIRFKSPEKQENYWIRAYAADRTYSQSTKFGKGVR